MALTKDELLDKLKCAGDTIKLGEQRVPQPSERGAAHAVGDALVRVAAWGRQCVHGQDIGVA
eukprot:1895407-Pleurochrysis_carterae.AAC.3